MSSEKKQYPWIDVGKLLCALLVVFMHTYCFDGGVVGNWVKYVLSSIGVPYFFIASGFFYAAGLHAAADKKAYFKSYFKRVLLMYLIWTALVFPISWMNISRIYADKPLWYRIAYYMRGLFLRGSLGVYWYLHSLVINCCILYWAHTRKRILPVFAVSVLFFILGVLFDSGLIAGSLIHKLIYFFFSSERNFLTVGLFYMMVGYFLHGRAEGHIALGAALLVLGVIVETILMQFSELRFAHAITATGLFLLAAGCTRPLSATLTIRKLSTAIYLIHFPFILVFDYYLRRGTLIDFPCTLLFSVALYYLLKKLLPENWMKRMFG